MLFAMKVGFSSPSITRCSAVPSMSSRIVLAAARFPDTTSSCNESPTMTVSDGKNPHSCRLKGTFCSAADRVLVCTCCTSLPSSVCEEDYPANVQYGCRVGLWGQAKVSCDCRREGQQGGEVVLMKVSHCLQCVPCQECPAGVRTHCKRV